MRPPTSPNLGAASPDLSGTIVGKPAELLAEAETDAAEEGGRREDDEESEGDARAA